MSQAPTPGITGLPGPLDVTPQDVGTAGEAFFTTQLRIAENVLADLSTALAGCGGMAGDDPGGHQFAGVYDPAAAAAITALCAAVPSLGSMSVGLVVTANNYITADFASTNGAAGDAPTFDVPPTLAWASAPAPPSSIGSGAGSGLLPGSLQKYWPNGHQDRLRNAANAWDNARVALESQAAGLQQQVNQITEASNTPALAAMTTFWAGIWGPNADTGCLGVVHKACGQLRDACNRYATALDNAHSGIEQNLGAAGLLVGGTSFFGAALSAVTGGASDELAAMADGAEADLTLGPTLDAFTATLTREVIPALDADLVPVLQAAADNAPVLNAVEAETTQVEEVLDGELAGARTGGGGSTGGSGGAGPPTGGGGGGGEPPGEPQNGGGGGGGGGGEGDLPKSGDGQPPPPVTPQDLMADGGAKIGVPGDSPGVRVVPNEQSLNQLFDELSAGGQDVTPATAYDGKMVQLPDGTRVGLRATSDSGGPTIDINSPTLGRIKVHIPWPPTP